MFSTLFMSRSFISANPVSLSTLPDSFDGSQSTQQVGRHTKVIDISWDRCSRWRMFSFSPFTFYKNKCYLEHKIDYFAHAYCHALYLLPLMVLSVRFSCFPSCFLPCVVPVCAHRFNRVLFDSATIIWPLLLLWRFINKGKSLKIVILLLIATIMSLPKTGVGIIGHEIKNSSSAQPKGPQFRNQRNAKPI